MFRSLLQFLYQKYKSVKIIHKLFSIIICVIIFSISFAGYFFYIKTSEIIVDNSRTQMMETIKQTTKYLNERLDFVLQQFIAFESDPECKNIFQSNGDKDYISEFLMLASKFEKTRMQNSLMVEDMFFYRYDDKLFYEYTNILNRELDYFKTDSFISVRNNHSNLLWYKTHKSDIYKNFTDKRVFSLMKELSDYNNAPHGILVLDIKEKFLQDALKSVNLGKGSKLFIIDKDRNIISSSDENDNLQSIDLNVLPVFSQNGEQGSFELSQNMLAIYDTIQVNGWTIVATIPSVNLMEKAHVIKGIVIYIVSISVVLFAALALFGVSVIARPIGKLVNLMKTVETGALDVRFISKNDDEIGMLGQSFNHMLESIKELMNQVKEEREMKVSAELRALQQQINSHFLYNTLDSIYWMGKSGDGENAAEMAAALANFIRLGLNKGSDMTTVTNEIEHIKNYMAIQTFRYDEKFDYSIEVESELYTCVIPKLILQPLVENAILHGIDEKDEKGVIQIRGVRSENRIIFEVIDNGIGMNVETVKQQIHLYQSRKNKENKGGYALFNVYNRIKMRYHDQGDIEFFSMPNAGTRVVISLPIEQPKNN